MAVRAVPYHSPDKNPGLPDAHKRFERLGLIHRILRDERRDRYNHFLENGFPRWRGTGYFYARFRPGLWTVLLFLVALSAGVQWLVQTLNFRKDQQRLEKLRRSALAAAWGAWFQTPADAVKGTKPRSIPAQKKVRVPLYGYDDLPPAPTPGADGSIDWDAEGHKVREALARYKPSPEVTMLDVMVFSDGSMAMVDEGLGEWMPIEPLDAANAPSWKKTWPFEMAGALLARATGSQPKPIELVTAQSPEPEAPEAAVPAAEAPAPATTATATPSRGAQRRKRGGRK